MKYFLVRFTFLVVFTTFFPSYGGADTNSDQQHLIEAFYERIETLAKSEEVKDRRNASLEILQLGGGNSKIVNSRLQSVLRSLLTDSDERVVEDALNALETLMVALLENYESGQNKDGHKNFHEIDKILQNLHNIQSFEKATSLRIKNAVDAVSFRAVFHHYLDNIGELKLFDRQIASLVIKFLRAGDPEIRKYGSRLANSISTEKYSGVRAIAYFKLLTDTDPKVQKRFFQTLSLSDLPLINDGRTKFRGASKSLHYRIAIVGLLNDSNIAGWDSDEWQPIREDIETIKKGLEKIGVRAVVFLPSDIEGYVRALMEQ